MEWRFGLWGSGNIENLGAESQVQRDCDKGEDGVGWEGAAGKLVSVVLSGA